jgi:hypothetical protein
VTANILGAEVVVDGAVIGTTTGGEDAFEVAASSKRVEVRRSGYGTEAQMLALQRGKATAVVIKLERVRAAGSAAVAPAAPAAPVAAAGQTHTFVEYSFDFSHAPRQRCRT